MNFRIVSSVKRNPVELGKKPVKYYLTYFKVRKNNDLTFQILKIYCIKSMCLKSATLTFTKVIHPEYYERLKEAAQQSFGQIKMDWFLAD